MNCQDAAPLLVAMAHRDLANSEEPPVREHLSSCAGCRAAEADYQQMRALLRAVGRRDADREAHLWERVDVLRAKLHALFEREAPAPASSAPEATLSPVPRPSRPHARVLRLAGLGVALVVATLVAIPLRQAEVPPEIPDRARLMTGPVRIEVEEEHTSVVDVGNARIEARGPAAYVARLWASRAAFERGVDPRTREWAARTGLILANWPVLEVGPVSGLVTVENGSGRVTADPGEVVFASARRFLLLRE